MTDLDKDIKDLRVLISEEEIQKKLDDIEKEVRNFKDTYLEKEDFIRNMAEINHKFDRMDDKLDRVIALLNREGK